MIPLPYLLLAILAAMGASYAAGHHYGSTACEDKHTAVQAQASLEAEKQVSINAEHTTEIVERWHDRDVIVEKKVPVIQRVLVDRCVQHAAVVPAGSAAPAGNDAQASGSGQDAGRFDSRLSAVLAEFSREETQLNACIDFVQLHAETSK